MAPDTTLHVKGVLRGGDSGRRHIGCSKSISVLASPCLQATATVAQHLLDNKTESLALIYCLPASVLTTVALC